MSKPNTTLYINVCVQIFYKPVPQGEGVNIKVKIDLCLKISEEPSPRVSKALKTI